MPPSDAPPTIRLEINDREIQGRKGETILQAAGRFDIYIPHYCWHPGLSIAGNCRLCLVEIALFNPKTNAHAKQPKPVIACQTPIAEGMKVWTDSPMARDCQKGMMEFLLANHPLDCPICDRGGECQLQRYSMEYGVGHSSMTDKKRKYRKPKFDALIDIERNRCIMCTRCVRFCDEIAGEHLMGVFARGNDNYIGTFGGGPVESLYSGNIIDTCPVGCLTSRPYRFKARAWELAQVPSTCLHCSSGCKVTYWTKNGSLYRTTPPARKRFDEYTLNEDTIEWICNIGRFASDGPEEKDRWTEPRIRAVGEKGDAGLRIATWKDAIKKAAEILQETRKKSGPESIAVLISPRASNEEGYLAARLAREVLDTNHVDYRLWPVTPDAALAASRALANADGDLENPPDAVLVLGGDLSRQSPIKALWIKEFARKNKTRIVCLGSHHDAWLSRWAAETLHCPPGQTAATLQKLAEAIQSIQKSPAPAPESSPAAAPSAPASAALSAPSPAASPLERIAALMGQAKNGLIVHSLEDMGGAFLPEEVPAVENLRKVLGANWKSMPAVQGRNAIGLFAVGAEPGRLPGGPSNEESARERVEDLWKDPLSDLPGMSGPEILQSAAQGELKALVVIGQDIFAQAPDAALAARAIEKIESLIVFDLFPGCATPAAKVFLPLPAPWESEGVYADLEGNLARLAPAEEPKGQSCHAALILAKLAEALGRPWPMLNSIESVYNEWRGLAAPASKITFDELRLEGPGNESPIRTAISHEDKALARTRDREFNPGDYRPGMRLRWSEDAARENAPRGAKAKPASNAPSPAAPAPGLGELLLIWGRHAAAADPWLDRSVSISVVRPRPYIEIHPGDAKRLGLADGDYVNLRVSAANPTGQPAAPPAALEVKVCEGPAPGCAYIPQGVSVLPMPLSPRPARIALAKAPPSPPSPSSPASPSTSKSSPASSPSQPLLAQSSSNLARK